MPKPGKLTAATALVMAAASRPCWGSARRPPPTRVSRARRCCSRGRSSCCCRRTRVSALWAPTRSATRTRRSRSTMALVRSALDLPGTLWSANRAGNCVQVQEPRCARRPLGCQGRQGRTSGLLKVVGKGAPIAVPNGPASIDVVVSVDSGARTYHLTFIGTGDGGGLPVQGGAASLREQRAGGHGGVRRDR